jgi:riboflavin synthase
MFTGIVEEVGELENVRRKGNIENIEINCKEIIKEILIGDSVCANGVCLTVIEKSVNAFKADVSSETLKVSAFKRYTKGTKINLEQSIKLNDKLSGHIVLGHVDATGKIIKIDKMNNYFVLTITFPDQLKKYIAYKGSISVDGISLTVSQLSGLNFSVSVIPFTYYETNLQTKRIGDIINIEIDVIARYLERLMGHENNEILSYMKNSLDGLKD